MEDIKGIVVCIDYSDLLSITLPRNISHLSECLVITSPDDHDTQQLVKSMSESMANVDCLITNAFYRYGAHFNKGLALEEGFNLLRRDGWILIWDADIVFPDPMPLPELEIGKLYSPHRRDLIKVDTFSDELEWHHLPKHYDRGFWGYYQLFNAADPALAGKDPWYEITFTHAGGSDNYFQSHWSPTNKVRPDFEVLHLGPSNRNWFGRVTGHSIPQHVAIERSELQLALHQSNGWEKGGQVGPCNDRVSVPGYVSTFKWNNSSPPPITPIPKEESG